MIREIFNHSEAAAGFVFDPEAWVELAYPAAEKVTVIKGGERKAINARFTTSGFEKMVSKFRAAKTADSAFSLLVNLDHLAFQDDQRTDAAAWVTDLKVENGRLFGKFKWSQLGESLARGGVYRFVSVEVTDNETPRETWDSAGAEWNVLQGVAITNCPKLEALRPFSHRAETPIEKEIQPKGNPAMEKIIAALGLDANAAEDVVLNAIQALKDKLAAADAEKAETEMKKKADEFCAKHSERFVTPEAAVAFFRSCPDRAEELAGTIRIPEKPAEKPAEKPITHRKGGTPEDGTPGVSLAHFRSLTGKARKEYLALHKAELMGLERQEKAG